MSDKENILTIMRAFFKNRGIRFPKKLQVSIDSSTADATDSIKITMCKDLIINDNMQNDYNAFEAWSIAIRLATNKRIILDTDNPLPNGSYEGKGHLCRFLYRALRFSEQYSWFSLSGNLKQAIDKFDDYIRDNTRVLINNYPQNEASDNDKNENLVEKNFAENGIPAFQCNNAIFRQLPVGLYHNTVSNQNMIFTGNKSAIDLWTWDNAEFIVFELKTDNKMVGIVTEIFFYSNYLKDLLCKKTFTLNQNCSVFHRGYDHIVRGTFSNVAGIMLADDYHPIITQEFLKMLNQNNGCGIRYEKSTYDVKEALYGCNMDKNV